MQRAIWELESGTMNFLWLPRKIGGIGTQWQFLSLVSRDGFTDSLSAECVLARGLGSRRSPGTRTGCPNHT